MRRKVANHPGWSRIKTARFAVLRLEEECFSGPVSLFYVDEAANPLSVQYNGHQFCILNDGYSWLRHFLSVSQQHIFTTMFDPDGQVVQWFIDICLSHGTSSEGIPWWDDLYLDIAILPSGRTFVLDADELDEALSAGIISFQDHAGAWEEVHRLLELIYKRRFELMQIGARHRQELMPLLS
jgi:predicted RNA-binding protein associated with RNAse of E/G family